MRTTPAFRLLLGLTVTLLNALTNLGPLAASPAGAVTVSAGSGSGIAGETIDIAISTTDLSGQGVLSYELAVLYDPNLVTAVDALETGTLPASAGWGGATFHVTPGRITVTHAGSTALSGAGSLITIRFQASASALSGGFTTLELEDVVMNEGVPAVTTSNGDILLNQTPQFAINPNQGEIARGETLPFFANGTIDPPLTWGVTQPSVASISGAGELTGTAAGITRVFAVDASGTRDTTGQIVVRGMRVTVGSASVVQGNSVSVPVTVTTLDGLGVRAGQFTIEYTANLLTATGIVTSGTMLSGYSPTFNAGAGSATVSFAGTSDLTGAGTLFTLQLQASSSSSGGSPLDLVEALFNEDLPAARTAGSINVDPLPTITVSPDAMTLLAGETQQFTAFGSTAPVTWSTLNASVATISSGGLLTAVGGGTTRVRAVDAVGASDENASVVVYDFRVTVPELYATPGSTVRVPLLLSRPLVGLDVYSAQFTLHHQASIVTDARPGGGLMAVWGSPAVNEQSDRITIAGAGTTTLGGGNDSLIWIELDISALASPGTNVPITVTGFLCNEGDPSAQVVDGMLHVVSPVEITVTTSPAGLSIAVDGTSYTSPRTFEWLPGSSHTIATTSPQGSGTRYVFSSWNDAGAQSHTVVAPSFSTTYTASFSTQHLLTTAVSPAGGGSVAASPPSGDGYYAENSSVQLTATANSGYQFSHWSGDASGSSNPTFVFMSDPQSVTANFTALTAITVTTSPVGLEISVDGITYTSPRSFEWTPGSSHMIGVSSPQGSGGTRRVFASWSDGGAQSHFVTAPGSAITYTASFTTQHLLTTTVAPPGSGSVFPSPARATGSTTPAPWSSSPRAPIPASSSRAGAGT